MKTIVAASALLILLVLAAAILAPADGRAQQNLSIGVDADPSGNTATSLGLTDPCVPVKKGQTFQIDIFVTGVNNLLAWEAYFSFDGDVVNVIDRDVKLFQAANANSDVFDASDTLPSTGGLYRLGAIDIGQPRAPDSGSGVLARLTLKAVGAGLSPAALTTLDANNDGKIDLGLQLTDVESKPIGDTNGDGFFDGPLFNAQIAVDRDCPPEARTPVTTATVPPVSPTEAGPHDTSPTTTSTAGTPGSTPGVTPPPGAAASSTATPSATATPGEDGGSDWTSGGFIAMYAVIGGVAVLLLGGGAFLATIRRRSP